MHEIKKYFLLVDGYNVINSWDMLKESQEISLDAARELLIDIMAELAKITGEETIVVFDSYLQKNAFRQIYRRKGIEIVFTKEFETADNYIERLVSNGKKNEHYKVASSDAIIQSITFGKGASRMSSQELYYYYINSKEQAISRIDRKKKSKSVKNIVTLDENSLAAIEELEQKLKDL